MGSRFLTLQIPVPSTVIASPVAPWSLVATGIWGLRLTTDKADFVGIAESPGNPDTFGADQANPITSSLGFTAAAGYTYDSISSAYQHTVGAEAALVKALAITVGDIIQVSWGIFNRTAGSISFRLGLDEVDYQTNSGDTRFTPTFSTPNLVVIPTHDFDGVVIVTARKVTIGSHLPIPSPINYYAHYLPRGAWCDAWEDAIDLETGGDWEQLRAHPFRVADQMADGTRMSTYLKGLGLTLEGAWLSLIASDLLAFDDMPGSYDGTGSDRDTQPLWSGRVRSIKPSMARLELICESPSDADDLGAIVNDAQIQPIVYGNVHKLDLPEYNIINLASQNFDRHTGEIVVSPLIPRLSFARENADTIDSFDFGESDSAGLLYYEQYPDTLKSFAVLEFLGDMPDLSQWFVPGVDNNSVSSTWTVPSEPSSWFIECTSGKGAGSSRRIKAGSTITATIQDSSAFPGRSGYPLFMNPIITNSWESTGYQESAILLDARSRRIWVELDSPMTDIISGDTVFQPLWNIVFGYTGGVYNGTFTWSKVDDTSLQVTAGTNPFGSETTLQAGEWVPDRSYFRIVNFGRQYSLPITASVSPIFFIAQDNADLVSNEGDYVSIDNSSNILDIVSNILFLVPCSSDGKSITVLSALLPDLSKLFLLNQSAEGPGGVTTSDIISLFNGPGSLLQSFYTGAAIGDAIFTKYNHLSFFVANPGWNLEGIDHIVLCSKLSAVITAWARTFMVQGIQALRSASADLWYMPWLPANDFPSKRFHSYGAQNIGLGGTPGIFVNTLPPDLDVSSSSDWLQRACKLTLPSNVTKDITAFALTFGVGNMEVNTNPPYIPNNAAFTLNQLAIFACRTVAISKIFADISGPAYNTDALWTPTRLAALTNALVATDVIADHAHAAEDLTRRWIHKPFRGSYGDIWDVVDPASIEQACTDLWTKTQPGLTPLSEANRPQISYGITQAGIQSGDALAQFCRDGMLVGSRDGWGRVQIKSLLARTLLVEQDAEILESDLVRDSIADAPTTSTSRVVTAPLIRFCQVAGAPIFYLQVRQPQASTYDPSYAIGFSSPAVAERAWNICHRGYLASGAVNAREIRMDTVYSQADVEAFILQPRGTTFLDWISRPKTTLQPMISLDHPAARLPRGSRVKITHRLYAPGGQWGTIASRKPDPCKDRCTISLIMDLPA